MLDSKILLCREVVLSLGVTVEPLREGRTLECRQCDPLVFVPHVGQQDPPL